MNQRRYGIFFVEASPQKNGDFLMTVGVIKPDNQRFVLHQAKKKTEEEAFSSGRVWVHRFTSRAVAELSSKD
jgi:hypothetical protein